MTLTTTHNRMSYTADGIQTVFPYTFLIVTAADLDVYLNGVRQISGYSLSNVGLGSGGNVTFTTAPPAGTAVVLVRSTEPTQQVNFLDGDKLPAESLELVLDKAYAAIQDLAAAIAQAVQLEPGSGLSGITLPSPGAGMFFRWNSSGTALELVNILATDIASPIVAQGDLIQGGITAIPERVPIGLAGQVLSVVSGRAAWVPSSTLSATLIDAKGDLLVGTGPDTLVRKAVGAPNTVLTADPAEPDGLRWGLAGTNALDLPIGGADFPDGSGSGNGYPELVREIPTAQTANTPKAFATMARFNDAADQHLCWTVLLPATYGSGGQVRLKWKARTALADAVVWKAGFAPTVDGVTDDTTVAFNAADLATASTAPSTLGQVVEVVIPLTMTNAAANRLCRLFIGRDADALTDTLVGDAVLMAARFEWS